jgi:hypothetical protein
VRAWCGSGRSSFSFIGCSGAGKAKRNPMRSSAWLAHCWCRKMWVPTSKICSGSGGHGRGHDLPYMVAIVSYNKSMEDYGRLIGRPTWLDELEGCASQRGRVAALVLMLSMGEDSKRRRSESTNDTRVARKTPRKQWDVRYYMQILKVLPVFITVTTLTRVTFLRSRMRTQYCKFWAHGLGSQ